MAQPLPRFLETHATRQAHARHLERVVREAGGDMREVKMRHTAADSRSLRGIPCVGKSIAGVVAGTQPGVAICR